MPKKVNLSIGECEKMPTPQILPVSLNGHGLWFGQDSHGRIIPERMYKLYNDPIVLTRDEIEISK